MVNEVMQDSIAWGGQASPNDRHIPGSDMTAACRGSAAANALLRERMEDPRRRVSLGYGSVVVLLAVLTHDYGIDPNRISMEQNLSNDRVTALCTNRLGFAEVEGVPKTPRDTSYPAAYRDDY